MHAFSTYQLISLLVYQIGPGLCRAPVKKLGRRMSEMSYLLGPFRVRFSVTASRRSSPRRPVRSAMMCSTATCFTGRRCLLVVGLLSAVVPAAISSSQSCTTVDVSNCMGGCSDVKHVCKQEGYGRYLSCSTSAVSRTDMIVLSFC